MGQNEMRIQIGVCEIRIEPSEFKGLDYHVFYLGHFYITCPNMKMAKAFVRDLNDDYERIEA